MNTSPAAAVVRCKSTTIPLRDTCPPSVADSHRNGGTRQADVVRGVATDACVIWTPVNRMCFPSPGLNYRPKYIRIQPKAMCVSNWFRRYPGFYRWQ